MLRNETQKKRKFGSAQHTVWRKLGFIAQIKLVLCLESWFLIGGFGLSNPSLTPSCWALVASALNILESEKSIGICEIKELKNSIKHLQN